MIWQLLFACIDYDLKSKPTQEPGIEEPEAPIIETDLPPDCSVGTYPIADAEIDEECTTAVYNIQNPWNVEIEWQWGGLASEPTVDQIMVAPIVGNLTDDDGDGRVSETDTPDIVVVIFDSTDGPDGDFGSWVDGRLIAMDGASGQIHWMRNGFYWKGGPAIADIDNDGVVDVVAINDQFRVEAVDGATGATKWVSDAVLSNTYPHVVVADLQGDGTPEIIADNTVLNGRNGSTHFQIPISSVFIGRMPAVGDINQDGFQEICIANACYDSIGNMLWQSTIIGDYGHWSAIFDADGDAEGEVAMIGQGLLGIYDPDGTPLVLTNAGTGQPGPPCVADFDGDGTAELAWASSSRFNVYELDGTVLWAQTVADASGLAACSGYDVNGDGAYEILFADENTFYIFDGSTGAVLFSQGGHASGTIFEYPIVADIDNDDSAEIIISSNNFRFGGVGWAGITVFGHLGDGWAKSGPTWNVHDFAVTNIYSDGSVPLSPEPPWQLYNVYRARPTEDASAIDLKAEIVEICYAGCDPESIVRVAGQPINVGPSSVRANVPLSLYRKDGNAYTFLSSALTTDRIDAGTKGVSLEFETTFGRIDGASSLVIRADDWGNGFGTIEECDEWNNGIEYTQISCTPTPE